MKSTFNKWMLGLLLTAICITGLVLPSQLPIAHAEQQQVASVEQLKTEAFQALRGGQFNRTRELLSRAASLSSDPVLSKMVEWTSQYETQYQGFMSERHTAYDKAIANVQLLLKHGKRDYAMDVVTKAYSLADDKKAFRNEKWVSDLIDASSKAADQSEKSEQWLQAWHLYLDLSAVEPTNPLWKEKLKTAARRVRILGLYAPEILKAHQQAKAKEDEQVNALLNPPTTQPLASATTRPAAKDKLNEEEDAEAFKVDWHEILKGAEFDMLWDSLDDAQKNYYRDVTYRDLMIGGLKGLRAVVTTKGLEKVFPNLADDTKRNTFITTLDEGMASANNANAVDEQLILRGLLVKLRSINQQTVNLPEEVFVSEFADGALAELDPFSNVIWPSATDEFNTSTQGEFSGVGIQIERDEEGTLKVVSPLEDTPAYKAGIQAGDIVTHINGQMVKGILLNQAVKKIKGPTGSTVTLTVRSPDGKSKDYTLRRDTIKVASVKGWIHRTGGGWDYMIDPVQKIGYVRISSFMKTTSDDLDKALDQMKEDNATAVILDLRSDPGGLLISAIDVVDKFIKKGVIVSTHADRETPNQPFVATARNNGHEVNLPMVVLVNQFSASASEIVSGALKDHKRALIVGERSFGKGSVQMLFPLSSRSAYLKLTTSHYYLPSGRCLHREENSTEWGVDPDFTVEMTPDQMGAVFDARQQMDILHATDNLPAMATKSDPTTAPAKKKDLLSTDPQLSAALLLLRLQTAGAHL